MAYDAFELLINVEWQGPFLRAIVNACAHAIQFTGLPFSISQAALGFPHLSAKPRDVSLESLGRSTRTSVQRIASSYSDKVDHRLRR